MKKSFYWSAVIIAMLFVAGLVTHKTLAQSEEQSQPEETPTEESNPVVEPENGSDDQGGIEDSEEGDSEEGDESDESSDEGEVEGATFSAFRGGDDDDDNGHINICHTLGNGGYNQISVSKSGNLNGHNNHSGDIIPPFEKSGPDYPGKNWTTEGQAIWNNGCQPLPETGSITIVKVIADGSNQDATFNFTPSWKGDFSLGGGDSNPSSELEEGSYTVTETVPEGWNYPTIECTDQSVGDDGEVVINLAEGEDVTCTFTNSEEEVPPTTTTIHAQKIICDDESDLPNWGAGNVVDSIGANTASNWMTEEGTEKGCYFADWDFEWSYRNIAGDPDDNTPGFLGANWYPFEDGEATVDVANDGQLGIREVFDADYIPFTGQNTNENVSAEMYCGDDVLHYDNWEWVNATAGQPIYCVAWNVPLEKEEACRVQVVSEAGDEGVGNGNAVAAWIHTSWTHALESVATWIWDSYEVVDASQTEAKTFTKDFYVDGPVNDAMLKLAADNRYWITINGNEVASNTGELNYGAVTGPIDVKVTGNIQSGWNTITMKVENIGLEGYEQRPHDNPAAGIYELVINAGAENLCEQPPVDTTSDVTICKYENSLDGNLLSGWDVSLYPWVIDTLKTLDIPVETGHFSGTTEKNGCITFMDVPYGSYRLDEVMKEGWVNVSGAGSQVVVDSSEETFNLVNAHECNPEVNLIKNSGFETPIVVANGGAWEQFVNGTPLLEWVADFVDTTTDAPLEIQSGYSGWVGHDGSEQYAELDSTAPTTISQDVPTTPGNKYRLTYWRAARPGTEPTNNANRALVDGVEVDSNVFASVGGNPDWYPSPVIEFTAANTLTNIAFKDDGSSADSYGTFIDDVALYCVPPVEEHHNHVTICKAEVGHEGFLSGWTVGLNKYQGPQPEVEIVADTNEYEGVTDENGCITFDDVDLGQYLVNEVMQPGWEFFSGPIGPQTIDSDQGDYHFYITNQQIHGGDDDDDNGDDDDDDDSGSCLVDGYKYDENGNPLSGWTIGLNGDYYPYPTISLDDDDDYEGNFIGSDVTDENGYYCIEGEIEGPGSGYQVYEELQSGWYPVGASVNGEASTTPYIYGDEAYVNIPYIGDDMDVNFYNDDASIAGYKWNDADGEADYDEGESTLQDWPIELYTQGEGWALVATTTTDVDGEYLFGNLASGSYAVCEGDVSGWTQTYPQQEGEFITQGCYLINVGPGQDLSWYPFGNHQNPQVTGDDDDDNGRPSSSHRRGGSSNRGEVLGASTENNFCPFLRDYQHINTENDPAEVNKAKAFFNSYLGLSLPLDGTFDQSMFNAVVQFQNMFKPDVLDTWTEEYPGVLNDNATGYLYQTTKWKINSIICPGYETFPDKLIIAPGTTI